MILGLVILWVAAAYGAYVCVTWLRYGRQRPSPEGDPVADPVLDRFLPSYDVAERHSTQVGAPAEVVLAAACETDFEDSQIVRTIFRCRELLLGAHPSDKPLPRGLLAKTKALGWGLLTEI